MYPDINLFVIWVVISLYLHSLDASDSTSSVVRGVHCGPPLLGKTVLIILQKRRNEILIIVQKWIFFHYKMEKKSLTELSSITGGGGSWMTYEREKEKSTLSLKGWLVCPNINTCSSGSKMAVIPRCSRAARTTTAAGWWAGASGWAERWPQTSHQTRSRIGT